MFKYKPTEVFVKYMHVTISVVRFKVSDTNMKSKKLFVCMVGRIFEAFF